MPIIYVTEIVTEMRIKLNKWDSFLSQIKSVVSLAVP